MNFSSHFILTQCAVKIHRIAVEYLNEAKQKINDSKVKKDDHEKGVLEKVLDINEALAKPVAIDTLAAGIDTVSVLNTNFTLSMFICIILFCLLHDYIRR